MYYLVKDTTRDDFQVLSGDPHREIYKTDVLLDIFDTHSEACEARALLVTRESLEGKNDEIPTVG